MRANHLYVHVPFCARRCVYCDFSIAVRARVPVDEYLAGLEREWARHSESDFDLETVYLGGGTPSKLGGEGIARLMHFIRSRPNVRLRSDAEITLEANPEDVAPLAMSAWKSAGVNRISLGVQSFVERTLSAMHRTHDAAQARRAIETARAGGVENISIDLIFARPWSAAGDWERDLDAALELNLPHLSVYGLTVEQRTPLGRWVASGRIAESPEDSFEHDFRTAVRVLTSAGLQHYEVSNYGRPGAHSRHNWAYWRRKAYAGLGPSAHEFDGLVRRWNAEGYADWVARTTRREDPCAGEEELTEEQRAAEEVYLSLRTKAGLPLSEAERQHVSRWLTEGWAELDSERMYLTSEGWLRLDALATDLTHLRSRY